MAGQWVHNIEKCRLSKHRPRIGASLFQNNKLYTIAANIWGTRFKFYDHSNCLPEILGNVTYKTSILHLQPRQMTDVVAINNNNYQQQKQSLNKTKKLINIITRKTKQQLRSKINEDDDDETVIASMKYALSPIIPFSVLFFVALQSPKSIINANIPMAPMRPQLQNVRSSLIHSRQKPSSTIHESKSPAEVNRPIYPSSHSFYHSQCTSMTITTTNHYRQTNLNISAGDPSSTSPSNLSRSTCPTTTLANFIRPISSSCIQVKEPLSPRLTRTSSNTVSTSIRYRYCSPPLTVPSIANNIDAPTASATTTLRIDDSSGYGSSENQNNQINVTETVVNSDSSVVSTIPEVCFEPETYRNLYPLNSKQEKKLSSSDSALHQTTRCSHHYQQATTTMATSSYVSALSLQK